MNNSSVSGSFCSFLVFWASQAVSALGTAMTEYALVVWSYARGGTASSISTLSVVIFLPTIFFRFIAGGVSARWDKKRILIFCDCFAACGTAALLILSLLNALELWHLYLINFLLSMMNAFQQPAAYTASSLLIPPEKYEKAGALQGISGSLVSILAPALGSIIYSAGGLTAVLIIDLVSFAAALICLLLFIRLPASPEEENAKGESFLASCTAGIKWLLRAKPVLRLILFFTLINFFAKLGGDGMLSAFILKKTAGNQTALGMAQAAVPLGTLAGSSLAALMKPARNHLKMIYLTCGLTFLSGNVIMSFMDSLPGWCISVFCSYLSAAVMSVHLGVYMRSAVPIELHGRVFSARDTLQNCAIPLGLYLGGLLADHVFEPMMTCLSPASIPALCFGAGSGSGVALMFFLAGAAGTGLSIYHLLRAGHPASGDQQ